METVKEKLKALNIKMGEAEKRRERADVECLYLILDDKLVFRRGDGSIVGKKEYVAGFVSSSNTYDRLDINPNDVQVTLYEERPLSRCSLLLRVTGAATQERISHSQGFPQHAHLP